MPFSDPMADGPTIQLSSNRSINNGTNTSYDFDHNYTPNYDGHGKVIITLLSNEA